MPSPTRSVQIIKLATDLFARETGFSGPEFHELFAEYTDDSGLIKAGAAAVHLGGDLSDGLKSMPLEQQKAFLFQLCDREGRRRYAY